MTRNEPSGANEPQVGCVRSSVVSCRITEARLVAQGLSNAVIAERLFLSPRTVKAHVAHIFGKLGATNRAAATRFALERGLA